MSGIQTTKQGAAGRSNGNGGVLARLLNGDMKILTAAEAHRDKYLEKKKRLKEGILKELDARRDSPSAVAALFEEMARELFDMWADIRYAGMDNHISAAKGVLNKTIDDICSSAFLATRPDSILILDPTVGDGAITLHLMQLLRQRLPPEIALKLTINDLSTKMLELALSSGLKEFNPVHYSVNILAGNGLFELGIQPGTVDIMLISQSLDIIKGTTAKRRLLAQSYATLGIGGRLAVIGEDPPMSGATANLPIAAEVYFEILFDKLNAADTRYELSKIRDNGALTIISEALHNIDEHHSAFIKVAERRF